MKVKNNRRTFFPTCGSDDNINIINKNLNITDVPVSEAVNGKLTAQEKTELKNLITQNGSTDVITSYINTKLQKESIENNNVVLNVERTTDEDSYMYDNVAILQNGIEVGAAGISYGTDELPYVERIDIYPEYQNQGIGTKALKLIADKYGDYLIAPDNQDAARLYARLGELVETDITSYIDQGYGVYEIYEGLKNNMNVNKLNEASYGGAYDIEDDMYFTKDDILEFTDELIDSLQDKGIFVDLVDTYITDGNRLVIAVEDEDGNEIDTDEFIDMRKIRRPKDIYKYKNIFIKDILSQYDELKSFNEDLDEIPIVDKLNFINKRRNGMPGIANINEFIDCLNAVGKDKFMVKETKAGSNLSLADLKDEWMTLKRKGWKWYTKNIPGNFLTYYVFEKINEGENMNEDLDISNMDNSFKYRLLDRMKSDCEYYINGAKSNKHLFMQNPQAQIKAMKDIYNSFSEKDVPEWISMGDINNYEKQMCNPTIKNNMKENLVEDDLYQLKAEIEDEVKKYMISQGFEPDEVKDYSAVDVYFDSKEKDRVIVEVRAELSYDGLFELGLRLNKIVANYDKEAYFEPVEPGITNAYIHNISPEKTNKRSKQIKEDYEDEPNYLNDLYECLIQAQICIDKIRENYPEDIYSIVKLGIESSLDEFMEHDEKGFTIYGAINKYNYIIDNSSEDDNYYNESYDEDDENNNYPKNLPEQFYSLYDKLNGDFWTRKDELKQDIEEINDPKYSVEELNDEYVIVTDPEDDMHALQIFNGGTERTCTLDFDHIRYL